MPHEKCMIITIDKTNAKSRTSNNIYWHIPYASKVKLCTS